LVALVILAFIVTIAVTSFSNVRQKQRDSTRLADMSQLSKALELYFNDRQGSYPTDCSDPDPATYRAVSDCSAPTQLAPYLPTIATLNDPSGGATTPCQADGAVDPCTYSFAGAMPADNYTVYFMLERPLDGTGSRCNKLQPSGVSACP
jgi:type II secretory pathway pseudopilin PulG